MREDRRSKPVAEPERPTISVRIGRVEVRANIAHSPPAAPRKAPPQPRLGLEDYMKLRNGGRS